MLRALVEAVTAENSSHSAFVRADGQGVSYGMLASSVQRAAQELRASGAGPGVAVAIAIHEPAELLLAVLAAGATGATPVPLDPGAGLDAIERAAERAGASLVVEAVTHRGQLEISGRDGRPIDPRAGLVLFTSGSSGPPKAVVLGSTGLRANVDAILNYLPIERYPRTAVVLPLTYGYALVGQAFTTLAAGGTLLLLHELPFAAQVDALVTLGAQGLSTVPTSLRLLARASAELADRSRPRLGYVASAGAAFDTSFASRLRRSFPGARLFNQYGLTEASPRVAAISDDDPAFARGSVGRPLAGLEAWTIAPDGRRQPPGTPGEIVVRGPSVMLGYLDEPAATDAVLGPDGALRTGDAGTVDAAGYLHVEGRLDGVVKIAGERVGLDEVGAVLRGCDGVADAWVGAVPDPVLGSKIVAIVEAPSELVPIIRARTRAQLPPAKRPGVVLPVSRLPRNPSGKVDAVAARALAEQGVKKTPEGSS